MLKLMLIGINFFVLSGSANAIEMCKYSKPILGDDMTRLRRELIYLLPIKGNPENVYATKTLRNLLTNGFFKKTKPNVICDWIPEYEEHGWDNDIQYCVATATGVKYSGKDVGNKFPDKGGILRSVTFSNVAYAYEGSWNWNSGTPHVIWADGLTERLSKKRYDDGYNSEGVLPCSRSKLKIKFGLDVLSNYINYFGLGVMRQAGTFNSNSYIYVKVTYLPINITQNPPKYSF